MTKIRKRLLIPVILALLLAACFCLFVACDGPIDNDAVKYTVTVKTDATTPASGVKVQIKTGSGVTFDEIKTTNSDGKVEFELVAGNYEVLLTDLPEHYSVPDGKITMTADNRNVTVTLEKVFTYTVKLVNPDGTPFTAARVGVGICKFGENCLEPVAADENGIAVIEADPANYYVHIPDLDPRYRYEFGEEDYYTETLSATKTELSIVIHTITELTSATVMTDAEKAAYFPTDTAAQQRVARKSVKSIKKGEIAYYSITASFTGVYKVSHDSDLSYIYDIETFTFGENASGGNGIIPGEIYAEAGKTYYFKAINRGDTAATAEVVITVPYSTYAEQSGIGANLDVEIGKANTNAIVKFNPTVAGKYKISVTGNAKLTVVQAFEPDEVISAPADDEFVQNPTATYTAYTSELNANVYVAVTTKTPSTVKVKIEKTADIVDNTTVVPVNATLTQYEKPEGKVLVGVPMDGTAVLVLGDDGYYHYGAADGPVVVVNITKPIGAERFGAGAQLAYMELTDSRLATYVTVTKTADGENTTDYRKFIRGFDDYEYDKVGNPVVPENIATEKYYAKYVNADGVYPLNAELKAFLQAFYEVNAEAFLWQIPMDADLDCAWLFPCYYYDAPSEADPIEGEYKFVKHIDLEGETTVVGGTKQVWDDEAQDYVAGTVGDDEYKLVIGKNIYIISKISVDGYDEEERGIWRKNSETGAYIFAYLDWVTYTVTFNAEAGSIKLVGDDETEWEFIGEGKTPPVSEPDAIIGEYIDDMGVTIVITATGYVVSSEDEGEIETGTWTKNDNGTYTFSCVLFGEQVTYTVTYEDDTVGFAFAGSDEVVFSYTRKPDAVIGEYEGDDGTLVVTATGYTISSANPMTGELEVTESGTWTKNDDGTYSFSGVWNGSLEVSYVVTLDNGTITFVDNDPDGPGYIFAAKSSEREPDSIRTDIWTNAELYIYDDNSIKVVNADGDAVLEAEFVFGQGYTVTVDYTYSDSATVSVDIETDTYTITLVCGEDTTTYTFALPSYPVATLLCVDPQAQLEIYDDNTVILYTLSRLGFSPSLKAAYTVGEDGEYTFTIVIDQTYSTDATVSYDKATGTYTVTLTFGEGDEASVRTYTFAPEAVDND